LLPYLTIRQLEDRVATPTIEGSVNLGFYNTLTAVRSALSILEQPDCEGF
jgi:hypothetical protein